MLKYSKQREAIKNYLMSTKEHPTADTVYLHVKEEFPNISLGTVYRNLNLLADIGEVTKISFPKAETVLMALQSRITISIAEIAAN